MSGWRCVTGLPVPQRDDHTPATGISPATFGFQVILAPGNYEFRYYSSTGSLLVTSGQVTILPAVVEVNDVVSPDEVTAGTGGSVQVDVIGGRGNRFDWVGMYRVGETACLNWFYLNGTQVAPAVGVTSASFPMTLPDSRGTYEFRFIYTKASPTLQGTSTYVHATAPMTPRERFGVVTFDINLDLNATAGTRVDELGVGTVRGACRWSDMQTSQGGQINWTCTDSVIKSAATRSLRVLMSLGCTPTWANPSSNPSANPATCDSYIPTNMANWSDFVEAFVNKYKGYDVVLGVYNETNIAAGGNMSYQNYCSLFEATASARGNSWMPIAGPETSWHGSVGSLPYNTPHPYYFSEALNCMLDDMQPQDIVTLHYYQEAFDAAGLTVADQMTTAASLAQGHEVWATEFGIDTTNTTTQKNFVTSFFDQFDDAALTNDSWTTSIFYTLYANSSDQKFALTNTNWTTKPGFDEYAAIVTELTGQGTGALGPGEALTANESLVSDANTYQLIYQNDGDLVLFDSVMQWQWHSSTSDPNQAVMQTDGNFVVYNSVPTDVWSSGTIDNPNAYLVVQGDGEMRIYNSSGRPIFTLYPSQ